MNAYEFTRFDADFTAKMKSKKYYDSRALANLIISRDANVRKTEDYVQCKDAFIECTMSCNEDEAKGWLEYWMANAIAYGIQTKKSDWRMKFLAAYDILDRNF